MLQPEEKIDKLGDRLEKRWKQTGRFRGGGVRMETTGLPVGSHRRWPLSRITHRVLPKGLSLLNTGSIP